MRQWGNGDSLAARFDAAGAAPPFQPRTATSNLLAALKLCAMAGDLERGRSIHNDAVDSGADANPFVASSLVSMYAKCGSVREARRVFEAMPCHGVVSWTALIQGYVENKEELLALDLFAAMARAGGDCQPNGRTFVVVLKACSRLAAKDLGDELVKIKTLERVVALHAVIDRTGCGVDIFVANALLDAYARCGSLVDASEVFSGMAYKDVVSWTSLILGFAENSQGEMALHLFELMQRHGCSPNSRTCLAAVKAIAALAAEESSLELDDAMLKVVALEKAMALHSLCVKSGCQDSVFERARFFDDVVLWTALILAHADSSGDEEQALEIYVRMRRHGCAPDARTYVALLKVCGKAVALRLAKAIHGEICRHGFEHGELVANALVDAYGKCGSAHNAEKVFLSILSPDAVAHTSLMAGLCRQGNDGSTKVFQIFHEMLGHGLRIDGVTLLCLLTASSHAGLVTKGKQIFTEMQRRYGISPEIEHYHAVIDLLGRTNHLEEAMNFARTMPFKPTVVTWTTMLTWCSKWKDQSLGSVAFQKCLEIDTQPNPSDDEKQSQRGVLDPETLSQSAASNSGRCKRGGIGDGHCQGQRTPGELGEEHERGGEIDRQGQAILPSAQEEDQISYNRAKPRTSPRLMRIELSVPAIQCQGSSLQQRIRGAPDRSSDDHPFYCHFLTLKSGIPFFAVLTRGGGIIQRIRFSCPVFEWPGGKIRFLSRSFLG